MDKILDSFEPYGLAGLFLGFTITALYVMWIYIKNTHINIMDESGKRDTKHQSDWDQVRKEHKEDLTHQRIEFQKHTELREEKLLKVLSESSVMNLKVMATMEGINKANNEQHLGLYKSMTDSYNEQLKANTITLSKVNDKLN